jgi:hypothetical protein
MTVSLVKATERVPCATSWACVDCLFLLANGDTDPMWSDAEQADFLARFERGTDGAEVTLGMLATEHDETCPNYGDWQGHECSCETRTFSWSPCGVCGSSLGGSRHAVTFWIERKTWPASECASQGHSPADHF